MPCIHQPKMLRGIFRKRRHLLHLLFKTATDTLRDAFRTRLALPAGRIAAAAAVHTGITTLQFAQMNDPLARRTTTTNIALLSEIKSDPRESKSQ